MQRAAGTNSGVAWIDLEPSRYTHSARGRICPLARQARTSGLTPGGHLGFYHELGWQPCALRVSAGETYT
eukprot:scaffold293_cov267-Prasinococcus_capsulatus_cf.AAC.8